VAALTYLKIYLPTEQSWRFGSFTSTPEMELVDHIASASGWVAPFRDIGAGFHFAPNRAFAICSVDRRGSAQISHCS
jgi:hypothetical protein